jgi:hypothetical protein
MTAVSSKAAPIPAPHLAVFTTLGENVRSPNRLDAEFVADFLVVSTNTLTDLEQRLL